MNMFSEYHSYLADNPKGYWFKRKLYGWGWTPAKKEGWIATFVYLFLIIAVVTAAEQEALSESISIGVFGALTLAFVVLCAVKGEAPKWQWGKHTPDGNK